MEIMHSKFLKLQTALLSVLLLFSVLLPQTALAAGGTTDAAAAQDTVTLVDPNTFNSWEKIQGTRSITQGRIWADKTVSDNEIKFSPNSPLDKQGETVRKSDGSDFLVALSALSSTSSLTKPEPQPIDIVLVLDASGSMSDPMGGTTWENYDHTERIEALKTAAKNFLAAAKKQNDEIEDPAKQIKVSIVKFAGDKTDKVGNDKYRDGGYWYNHSQIMRNLTLCNNAYLSTLQDVVDSISPAGATRSDYGMELAQTALDKASARSNAKKVVIFFTDGKPTSRSDYNAKVAGGAINTAKTLKDSGTTIYTVGIFSGADSSNPPAMPGQDEKKLANRFMHAVSSNYPAASSSGNDWDGYTVSMGTRAENSNYYKTATKSTELNTVFQEIFTDVTSDPPVPTLVKSSKDATESGYVTFEDPLGDYMTVTDFNAIAFSDKIYTAPAEETHGNVTTYTFTGINKGNVAYPQNVDLNKIIITVTHDDDLKIGDKVKVEIPAALLPLRYYNIAEDKDGKVSMEITPTYPIHVFYSVSLKTKAKQQMESGVITDTALASYVAAHIEEGDKAYFYSNLYTGANKGTDAEGKPYTAGDTTASFVPAETNSFYYYTEDTPLYEDKDCTRLAKNVQPNMPYYYDMPYYQTGIEDANGSLKLQHAHIKVSIATQEEINDTLKKDKDGVYYVPKGTLKGSYPQALDNQLGGKEKNITNTASRRIDFGWDNNYTIGRLYLGNNGKIGYNATGSLKITKKVAKADPSYSPDAETQFGIQVVLEGNGAGGSYTYTINGDASDSHPFTSGGVIALKNGQTAEIEGLPAGCEYTVSEPTLPDGYTSSIDAPAGVITAGKVQDTAPVVTVTNTYEPSSYTLNGETNLSGKKVLSGRDWQSDDKFVFHLEALEPDNAPLPKDGDTDLTRVELMHREGTQADTEVPFNFGDITYTKPGTYRYRIYEETPSNAAKIPGIDYDTTTYTVTVKIKDNGKGQLELDTVTKALDNKDNVTEMPADNIPLFKNIFNAKNEEINFVATKVYKDNAGTQINPDVNQFQFTLSVPETDSNGNNVTQTNPPMPTPATVGNDDGGQIAFGKVTYTAANVGNTYWYQMSEDQGDNARIAYDKATYLIKVEVDSKPGADNKLIVTSHTTYYKQNENGAWQPVDINTGDDVASKITFTNTLTPTPATARLSIGKILEGRNWMEGDTFTFILTAKDNAPMPEGKNANKLTITNESNKGMDDERLGSFGDITFTQPGTYVYTISEDEVKLPGFKNHPGAITATVTVTRNGNELTSTVSYKDAAGKVNEAGYGYFTNTYSPAPYTVSTSVLFKASKTLEGRGWLPEENFTFVLTGDESNPVDTPMPDFCEAVANSSHTTVTLGDDKGLTFTKPDTYTYYITEKKESTPGLIYDTSKYKVVVTVEDKDADGGNIGKSGKLTGSVQYFKGTLGENGEYTFSDELGANIAAFTNTYTTEPATLKGEENLSVTKKLVGREWGNEEAFTFTIAAAGDNAENTPLPSEKTLTLTKPTPDGDTATDHFGDITYTKPGTYSYTISEVQGADNTAAITQWDDSVYTVNVTVEDNGAGELRITDVKVESDGSNYSGISFTNRYEANPNPTKTVTDESHNNIDNTLVSPGQKLTYTIHWVNNAVNATGNYTSAEITVTDTVPANTTFDSADNGGTWDKTDNKVTWKFTADPNTEGDVSFTVKVNESISGENGEIDNYALVGNRTTNITHNYLPGKTADKDANTTLKVGDELTYTIKYKNLEDAAATVTVTDAVPAGTEFVSAENGGVCKNGTVTWNIADVASGTEGSVSFKVRVTVDAVGNSNSIENQAQVKIGDHNPVTTTKTENKNIEKPSPASVTLTACKTLISDVGNHTLAAGEFAFTLLDKDGKLVQTAPNDAEGNVTFEALSLDTIGNYTYTICEVDGNVGYITYDGSQYTVTFSVYDAKDGTLAATKPVYSLNGKTVDAAEFINHYTAELPADASFSLSATKALTGRSIIDGEFFFTLEDEGGNIVATASSDAKGNIQFPAVGLKNVQAAYTALLAAAEPVQPAAEPTPAEDEQPVKIEDGEQAPLETAVAANSLEGTPAVVTDAEPETELDAAPETEPETDPENEPETEPETEPAPTVDTDAVQALLTRWYTIREYAQGKDGVTYDANTYMVRVQLADKEGQGTLIVDSIQFFAADGETPLDNNAVVFNNSYAAEGVDLTVTAQKQLTGRSMADGEFSFRLSCNDDPANEQTVTSDANGRIAFALHYDDKDGTGTQETHTYTVTEVRGDNDTITYDDTAYTFTVEVIDDGTGHLTTKVTQPEAMVFRNVYTPKATSITLAGNKVLNGRAQKAGEFTFELCDANGAVIATAANGENGYFAFPALSYDEAGEYTYTVREKDTGVGRVTYDKTVYSVTVQVRDEDGQLKADIILPASGLTFTNTYTPEPAQTPAPTPKPTTSPAPAATAAPTPAPARIPQTADSFPLALLIGLLAVSGGALAVLLTARKRGKK
ncbi:Spy0128 family protein [uncultured Gemmiger sp.]|uniref:Spy0128 family protein n=1 Tax=uncultured Gemmiger sp. TaxID=1623490 RepID=UPI0025EA095D|nr:FctA domain-containing protein [uncultured Gemmiger sp.]